MVFSAFILLEFLNSFPKSVLDKVYSIEPKKIDFQENQKLSFYNWFFRLYCTDFREIHFFYSVFQ